MSGGSWGYQQYKIEELAGQLAGEVKTLLESVAQTEHIVDWAEACDTSREQAEHELYDLWVRTFSHLYPNM